MYNFTFDCNKKYSYLLFCASKPHPTFSLPCVGKMADFPLQRSWADLFKIMKIKPSRGPPLPLQLSVCLFCNSYKFPLILRSRYAIDSHGRSLQILLPLARTVTRNQRRKTAQLRPESDRLLVAQLIPCAGAGGGPTAAADRSSPWNARFIDFSIRQILRRIFLAV